MSQEIITDYKPLFTGQSGKIEKLLRDLGQRPPEKQKPVNFATIASDLQTARSLPRQIHEALEKEQIPLPPKRPRGRPRTKPERTTSRHYITGDERSDLLKTVKDLFLDGETYGQIQAELGLSSMQVQYAVKGLREESLVPSRHKHRPPEVIDLFDDRVAALQRAGLSSPQIRGRLEQTFYPGITIHDVPNAVNRLMNQGRIEIPETQEETLL